MAPADLDATPSGSASTSSASGRSCGPARSSRRIEEDVASADASGVAGTPSFFVNGRRHHGAYDAAHLAAAVRAARNRAHLRARARAGALA